MRTVLGLLVALLAACAPARLAPSGDDGSGHVAPSGATARANAAVLGELPFADTRDLEVARRGFIAARRDPVIRNAEGREVWNLERFAFLEGPAPDSVNPANALPGTAALEAHQPVKLAISEVYSPSEE